MLEMDASRTPKARSGKANFAPEPSKTNVTARAGSTWSYLPSRYRYYRTTICLERTIDALRQHEIAFPDPLVTHVSPVGCEHINLTGDYTWRPNRRGCWLAMISADASRDCCNFPYFQFNAYDGEGTFLFLAPCASKVNPASHSIDKNRHLRD
jgi:Tn3 transposase DDE domain